MAKGWSHISLATIDMNATRKFYEDMQPRFEMSLFDESPITDFRDQ